METSTHQHQTPPDASLRLPLNQAVAPDQAINALAQPPSSHRPAPRSNSRRKGKVARLPDRVRQLVNLMLRDGRPYSEIIAKLNELGYLLSDDSISRWHGGGFQDWLHEENLLDDLHTRLNFAHDVINPKCAAAIQEAGLRIAIIRLYNLLLRFDPIVLQQKISEDPGQYARILNALCKLTSSATACERQRLERNRTKSSRPAPETHLGQSLSL